MMQLSVYTDGCFKVGRCVLFDNDAAGVKVNKTKSLSIPPVSDEPCRHTRCCYGDGDVPVQRSIVADGRDHDHSVGSQLPHLKSNRKIKGLFIYTDVDCMFSAVTAA